MNEPWLHVHHSQAASSVLFLFPQCSHPSANLIRQVLINTVYMQASRATRLDLWVKARGRQTGGDWSNTCSKCQAPREVPFASFKGSGFVFFMPA